MLNNLKLHNISGKEVLPIIEGGKGIGASNGISAGHFALAGAVGTFSGVNAQKINHNGEIEDLIYNGRTRIERHEELMKYSIDAAIGQAKIAYDIARNQGRIHMNLLWEAAGAERILQAVLEKAKGLVHGITCGAGMPYKLAEICDRYGVHYYPIVSSMRAFRALWKRSYQKFSTYLGGIVYEDPWKAGGHNGLSNAEDPLVPQDPYNRIKEIRSFMNEVKLNDVPIIMAGGVWNLTDYEKYLNNKEIGAIAFQFGTRPVVTKESPVPEEWKQKLLTLKEGDVFLNRFSPTGFYSSAVNNDFIQDLHNRSQRQMFFKAKADQEFNQELAYGGRGRKIYVQGQDYDSSQKYIAAGYSELLKTPDNSVVFVTKDQSQSIRKDQVDCMGCLSACKFSNWWMNEEKNYNTGKLPDPRSFCIQKTLQNIITDGNKVDNELMFSGHNAYRFAKDKLYTNGFIPTIQQLVDKIVIGE